MKYSDDINDNEIRLIGIISDEKESCNKIRRKRWLIVVAVVLALALAAGIVVLVRYSRAANDEDVEGIYEPQPVAGTHTHPLRQWLLSFDSTQYIGCAMKDTTVNDIAIRIYLPLNARPALEVGTRCLNDNNVILAFQAADIRADNKKIVGAFVQKGQPLAWGLSKKGYCAILHDSVYVGMADNSPLFEEATDCGGYFFRQYPLVAEGQPQESELKTQSIRRALCDVDEHICVIETREKAGMHDFAVLLADLDINNAIYLIGSDAMGIVSDLNGNREQIGKFVDRPFKYINFIFWTKQ